MTPEISEFSYGFALTNELINLAGNSLKMAPIFPSLIEEGRVGGGYDVHLNLPGFPLYIQFKRSDCMKRRNAKEYKMNLPLNFPFFRLKITEKLRSDQHDLLLSLDFGQNEVFYAAPLFYKVDELNDAYVNKKVAERSFYIRPRDIGPLDNESHHVSFDANRFFVCSEPREVPAIRGPNLLSNLTQRLSLEDKALQDGPLDKMLGNIEEALRKNGIREVYRDLGRQGKTESEHKLRKIADLSMRYFGAQFFVVQQKP